jgi:hypothetical protein
MSLKRFEKNKQNPSLSSFPSFLSSRSPFHPPACFPPLAHPFIWPNSTPSFSPGGPAYRAAHLHLSPLLQPAPLKQADGLFF